MEHLPILAIIVLFAGAFLNSIVGKKSLKAGKIVVAIAMLASFAMMVALIPTVLIDGQTVVYWMGGWSPLSTNSTVIAYGICLEVDALSLFFGLLVTLAVAVSGFYSFTYMSRDDAQPEFYTLFLMLSGSVLGLVLSGDLFNVFVMVEIMTFSAVALTAFRNTYEGALEGAFKYLAVGSIGSTCILVGTIMVYANVHTLNMAQIALEVSSLISDGSSLNVSMVVAFAFLFVGFATKAFLFPFQPLAADAHAVAPASISLMISGVLTKCGVYGIIRLIFELFQNYDQAAVQYLVTGFGCVTMFVCVCMAFNQHNFKRLLAFHSISQVGYVITAIGSGTGIGLTAGLFHAINHTLFKGLLFLVAGAVQHETGSLDLDKLGGLGKKMPRTMVLFLIGAASISGLPPFNGFASKWMIYQALYERAAGGNFFYLFALVVALITSVLTLASFVKVAQSVFFGQLHKDFKDAKETPVAMRAPMWVLAFFCVALGVLPNAFCTAVLNKAAYAAYSEVAYIFAALAPDYYAYLGGQSTTYTLVGSWTPYVWIIMLIMVTCAITIVAVTYKTSNPEELADGDVEDVKVKPANAKYEPFFSGEESHYSQVGGSDLFWGFKENWKKYFSFWHDWHSGITNDYVMYGVVCLAFVLVYCILFV